MVMLKWMVVCEAQLDAEVVTTLADRVICESVDWADGILANLRSWQGFESDAYSTWADVKRLARSHRIRVHGKPGTIGIRGEYLQAKKALRLGHKFEADGMILSRDTDNYDRRSAYESARKDSVLPNDTVCLAIAAPEIEAWLFHGFIPKNSIEQDLLSEQCKDLGYDPSREAHRLNPRRAHDKTTGKPIKTSTKRLFDILTGGVPERRDECFKSGDLSQLKERGAQTGLTAFLDDVVRLSTHLSSC